MPDPTLHGYPARLPFDVGRYFFECDNLFSYSHRSSTWRFMIQANGGGIFCHPNSNFVTVSILLPFWKDEWRSRLRIGGINGYRRAQYIADAVYYYTGSPAYHFKDANLSFPPLKCIGRVITTPELLSTREMCSNYVQHIADGEGYLLQRADFMKKVKDVVISTDFVLQRERFLISTRAVGAIPVAVVAREVQVTLKKYWELAVKCWKKVESMTNSVQFNHGLCQDLALKLGSAIEMASACILFSPPGLPESCYQSFKLLFKLAKRVESFKSHCCSDEWIQAALMLIDPTEYVSLLGIELDSCRGIFTGIYFGSSAVDGREIMMMNLKELFGKRQKEVERVKILARLDRNNLLEKVVAAKFSTHAASALSDLRKYQMATYLLGRLTGTPNVSITEGSSYSSSFLEVNYASLDQRESLGTGAAGDVHKTIWLGQEFAEKVFYGSDHPSFKNEVSILAGLAHPNVVTMFCYAMDKRSCSIVMELMEGDLFRLMQTRLRQDSTLKSPFIVSEAVVIILQVADGMNYLHGKKIVHRDLKSQNIFVMTAKGEQSPFVCAKVGDFGLSKTKETSSTNSNQTLNVGTVRWMAPEMMHDLGATSTSKSDKVELKHPFKSDIYSFGMVCYEILTGEIPFQTIRCQNEVKSLVLGGQRPNLPNHCPVVLRTLIQRCWDSDANARPCFDDICAELRYLKLCLLIPISPTTSDAHTDEEERRSWTEMKEELSTCTSRHDYQDILHADFDGCAPFEEPVWSSRGESNAILLRQDIRLSRYSSPSISQRTWRR